MYEHLLILKTSNEIDSTALSYIVYVTFPLTTNGQWLFCDKKLLFALFVLSQIWSHIAIVWKNKCNAKWCLSIWDIFRTLGNDMSMLSVNWLLPYENIE